MCSSIPKTVSAYLHKIDFWHPTSGWLVALHVGCCLQAAAAGGSHVVTIEVSSRRRLSGDRGLYWGGGGGGGSEAQQKNVYLKLTSNFGAL